MVHGTVLGEYCADMGVALTGLKKQLQQQLPLHLVHSIMQTSWRLTREQWLSAPVQ